MNYSRRHVIILFVLLFAGCTAHAAIPALLVADATFAPVDLLPGDMQAAATEIEHPVTIEGIELVHARTLANRADMRIYGNTSSGTAFIKTSAGPMHLRTLSTLDFWQDPAIRARTDYTPHTETVTCQRIVDGDTIKLAHGRRLRYIGVDTPETKHPNRPVEYYGKQASRFNKRLVAGRRLVVEYDVERKDRYSRTLGYVHSSDTFVNAQLVAGGYAQVSTYPPNVRYSSLFRWLQARARERGVGLWGQEAEENTEDHADEREAKQGEYVGSKNSDVYHQPDCRWARRIKLNNRVWFDSPEDAQHQGYRPCKVCDPPAN